MTDFFRTTTTTSYGQRIGKSFKGIILGIILFFGSFVLLYWNEGQVDYSLIAKTATDVTSTTPADASLTGKLIDTTGELSTDKTVGDQIDANLNGKIAFNAGSYIAVKRNVEQFAWNEHSSTTTTSNTGGNETKETTYTYNTDWTAHPDASDNFRQPAGHTNPELAVQPTTKTVDSAKVGIYQFDPTSVQLPDFTPLNLTAQNVTVPVGASLTNDSYIYIGKDYKNPVVGDIRIKYSIISASGSATIFGKLNGTTISSYADDKNNELFFLYKGTKEEAITSLHKEYSVTIWAFRFLGFILMWAGLGMALAPLSVLTGFIPMLESVSGFLINIATFIIALILTAITIVISMIFHNIVALVAAIIIAGAIIGFVISSRKKGSGKPTGPSDSVTPNEPPSATLSSKQ